MSKLRGTVQFLCWLLASGIACGADAPSKPRAQCPIPLEKGLRWIYAGTIEWTPPGRDGGALTTNIEWVSEVLDVKESATARAAVVSGFPDELAGYEPGQAPGFSVLLSVSNRVYKVRADTFSKASRLEAELTRHPTGPLLSAENEWLSLPLALNQCWGGDTSRPDHWYCWNVESESSTIPHIPGFPAERPVPVWTIAFRTNPDHQIFELAEGLGVTRYIFAHHGTVASAEVRLIAVKHSSKE